ncbi:LCP family protein [Alicyclobacillus sp. SO9]|uniref:LCP family protein n=1 Tax=Alicyclobacillus sp. SO9 TaxID=2665646 RepID=UPI0018E80E7A|nr:LCP family protein [Alicyclobacillus sp. SO9]QQE78673.1 LCP family protein [Alicyclobacillus sp. SO9]
MIFKRSRSHAKRQDGIKRWKWRSFFKYSALAFAVLVGGGLGFGTYQYQQLSAATHFSNLSVVGEPLAGNSVANGTANTSTNDTASNPVPTVNLPGTFNMLLIGSDARPGDKISHSDTMVLVHVDLNHHVYNMISLPRDSRTYFPGYGYTKLTTIQFMDEDKYGVNKGIEQTVKTVSEVTGVPINFYAETSFWGLQDMVNALGGINIDLPFTIKLTHPWHKQMKGDVFQKGEHFLTGAQTIEVVRERDSVPGGDYGRQQIQERALIGIAKEVLKPQNIPHLPALAKALPKYLISTNLSTEDLLSLGLNVKADFHPDEQIHYFQIPSTTKYIRDDVLKAPNDELILNQKTLKQVIHKYFLSANDVPPRQKSPGPNTISSPRSEIGRAGGMTAGNTAGSPGSAGSTANIFQGDDPGNEIVNPGSNPADFGPLGAPAPGGGVKPSR